MGFEKRREHKLRGDILGHMDSSPYPAHQKARRLLRAVPGACGVRLWRLPRDRARGAGTPGRLENDTRRARAADALLAVRKEGCGGRRSGEAKTARRPEEYALAG